MDWKCLHYGNSTKLHDCTWTGTVCSKVTAQRFMFVQGLELSAVRQKQRYILVQGLEISAVQ